MGQDQTAIQVRSNHNNMIGGSEDEKADTQCFSQDQYDYIFGENSSYARNKRRHEERFRNTEKNQVKQINDRQLILSNDEFKESSGEFESNLGDEACDPSHNSGIGFAFPIDGVQMPVDNHDVRYNFESHRISRLEFGQVEEDNQAYSQEYMIQNDISFNYGQSQNISEALEDLNPANISGESM